MGVSIDIIFMTFAFDPKIRYRKGLTVKPILKEILTRNSLSVLAKKKKGGSIFRRDICCWMDSGPLQELVRDIDLPDTITPSQFETMLNYPCTFLWNLLTFDIFKKYVLKDPVYAR